MRLKTYIFGGACLLAGLGLPIGMAASALEQAPAAAGAQRTDPSLETLRAKAQERMALDRNLLSSDEFRELESLYQSASRDLRSPDAKAKLKEVVRRFPQSNRGGCAILYLAQMSEGTEREEYLKSAIAKYGNSWYGDGVQVGALARAQLAASYANAGRRDEAQKLAEELRLQFPGAVDHSGARLAEGLQTLKPTRVP
jgi:hypothetical protein